MSIYATYHIFKLQPDWLWAKGDSFIEVIAQGVPGHIGHPKHGYETDPYSSFLPPVIDDEDGLRAMVFVLADEPVGEPPCHGQQYANPLLVMSGEEYKAAKFDELMFRLGDLLEKRLSPPTEMLDSLEALADRLEAQAK